MPMCGFNPRMLEGLTKFAQGLYEQALKRSQSESISIERAFEIEIEEMNVFLIKLDQKYYDDLRPKHTVEESMAKLVQWTAFYPKGG
jgi:hypothetical protein